MGYRVSPFLEEKKKRRWDLGVSKTLDAEQNRRRNVRGDSVEPWGVLWWLGGEGLGQGSQRGKVKETHSTVSSQSLGWGTGNCPLRLTRTHLELLSRSDL